MSSTKSTTLTDSSTEELKKILDDEVDALNQLAIRISPMLKEYANRRGRAEEVVAELAKRGVT